MKLFSMMKLIISLFIFIASHTLYAQEVNLSKMDSVKRDEYLINKSKEVIMNFGFDYLSACNSPEITGPFVFDEHDGFYRPEMKRNKGKKYYRVTYSYDHTKFFFSWDYAAYTLIWEKSGEPMAVGFGNGMGKHFLERPYGKWIEMGVKEDDKIPYEEDKILKQSYEKKHAGK